MSSGLEIRLKLIEEGRREVSKIHFLLADVTHWSIHEDSRLVQSDKCWALSDSYLRTMFRARMAGFWFDLMDNYREGGNVSARQINSLHSRTVSVIYSRHIE